MLNVFLLTELAILVNLLETIISLVGKQWGYNLCIKLLRIVA